LNVIQNLLIHVEMDQKYTILAGGMTEAINNMVDIQDRELDELRQEELELNEIETVVIVTSSIISKLLYDKIMKNV